MTSVLVRIFGFQHIDLITDAVQDTFESALMTWKYSGIPSNPEGWLMKVSKNKAINSLKRESKTSLVAPSSFIKNPDKHLAEDSDVYLPHEIEDSQLRLLLTCCHPDFSEKNQVIITLNILCGFGTEEIARALLMNTAAVKKAITRTKQELKRKGAILLTPRLPKYEKRVDTVHTILYLMFNEGYKTSRSKEMIDHDLCYEAIRLAKLLVKKGVVLAEETNALLALMFFNLARFPSRMNTDGGILTLAEQDRSKWDTVFIEEGYYYLNCAAEQDKLSRYHLEAIIASLHCAAKKFDDTDWKTIVYMYEQLELILDSPIVTLNKIVAQSYLYDPAISLAQLDALKKQEGIEKNYLLFAAEADMFRRLKNNGLAKKSYEKAYQLATSPLDKQFLADKISKFNTYN